MSQRTLRFLSFNSPVRPTKTVDFNDLGLVVNDLSELFENIDFINRTIAALPSAVIFSGDLSGTSLTQTVIGLQGIPIDPTAPVLNDILQFDGANWIPTAIAAGGVTNVTATAPITSSGGATPDISTSINTNKLIGRGTAGVGVMEEITLGTNLSLTGTTLNAAAGGGEDWAATLAIGVASGGNFPILSDGDIFGGSGYNYNWTFGSDDQFFLRSDGVVGTTHGFYLDQNTINIGSVTAGRYLEITAASNHLKNSTLIEIDAPAVQLSSLTGVGVRMVTASAATGQLSTAAIPTGTVTNVTATAPLTSTGGATPDISTSMATARLIGRTTAGAGVMEEIQLTTTGSGAATLSALALNIPTPTIAGLSPLTTKGDLFTFSTVNARIGIGTRDGMVFQVNNAAATGNAWSSATYPSAVGAVGKIIRSDGTDNQYTTSTFADTYAINTLLYNASANTVSGLATANSGILITSAGGVPSIGTAIPNGVTATTQATGDNSTKVATTAYADALTRSYCITGATATGTSSPGDAQTYFFGNRIEVITTRTTSGISKIYFPQAGTIIAARVTFSNNAGTNENSTVYLRYNNTTDITISSTVDLSATVSTYLATGLSQAVSTSDYVEFKWTTPTWATNPTVVAVFYEILVKPT